MGRGPSPYTKTQRLQLVAQWQALIEEGLADGRTIKQALVSLGDLTGAASIPLNTIAGWRRRFWREGLVAKPPYAKRDFSPDIPDNKLERDLDVRQLRVIDEMVRGLGDKEAALAVGVSRSSVNRWRHHSPQFAAELEKQRGLISQTDGHGDHTYIRSGSTQVTMQRAARAFGARLVEPVAPGPSTVSTDSMADFVAAFVDRVTEFRQTLAERATEIHSLREELAASQSENIALHNSIQQAAYKESNWNEQLSIISKRLQ